MRKCGDCQLCCKLLPVREIGKNANQKCKHQKFAKGCAIYSRRPPSCRIWNCGWLTDKDAEFLSRPDRSHYVVDTKPDFVKVGDPVTGDRIPAVQVWCDPGYSDAHADPRLREYLELRAYRDGMVAVIRYSATESFVLVAPLMAETKAWMVLESKMVETTHSQAEITEVMARPSPLLGAANV